MAPRELALLTAALAVFGGAESACRNMSSFATQLDTLLAEYDRESPPATPLIVGLMLHVHHASVSERGATVRLFADLHLMWEDKRIAWNATDWGCDEAPTAADRLWQPDVGILSVATLGAEADVGLRARLTADGRVSRLVRLDIAAPIDLQLANWPRDEQVAYFTFGSRSHSADEMQLVIKDLKHLVTFEAGAWELVGIKGDTSLWEAGGVSRNVATWAVALRRREAAHAVAAASVFTAAVLLLLAAALLPPKARPPLCAASALTAVLWLMSAVARLPAASAAPRIMSLLSATCTCAAVVAVGAALVLRVARCPAPPPQALRSLVTAVSTLVKLTPPEGSAVECSAWAAAARLLDYLLLSLTLFTLLVVVAVYVF